LDGLTSGESDQTVVVGVFTMVVAVVSMKSAVESAQDVVSVSVFTVVVMMVVGTKLEHAETESSSDFSEEGSSDVFTVVVVVLSVSKTVSVDLVGMGVFTVVVMVVTTEELEHTEALGSDGRFTRLDSLSQGESEETLSDGSAVFTVVVVSGELEHAETSDLSDDFFTESSEFVLKSSEEGSAVTVFTVVMVSTEELEHAEALGGGFTAMDSSSGGLSQGESEEALSDGLGVFTVVVSVELVVESSQDVVSMGMAVFTVVVVGNGVTSVGGDLGSKGQSGESEESEDGSHI